MNAIKQPLSIGVGTLECTTDLKQSIVESIELLINTPLGSCAVDMDYGFVFNNMAFENFNESDGTIFNTQPKRDGFGEHFGLYNKKISGSSKNISTFAADLREAICKYERRLANPLVSMTYIREERAIHVLVSGMILQSDQPFEHKYIYKLWR